MQARQYARGVRLVAGIPKDYGRLPRRRGCDQLIDGIELLEDQIGAQRRANLRPQGIVAGNKKHP